MEERVLPVGWALTSLENVAKWGSGGTPSRRESSYFGGLIPWVKTGELGPHYLEDTEEFLTSEGVNNSSAKIFPKGSVVVAMYGATIGKTSILGIDAATNQACAVGVPNESLVYNEYLYYYLDSQRESFDEAGKGGAQPNISQGLIKEWEIPLAPLNEQRRIATKLDTTLAAVESCRQRLEGVATLIKRFRQAVLEAAITGALTREWRERRGIKEEWIQTSIEQIANVGTGATPLRSNPSFYAATGIPWITSAATSEDLITDANECVTPEGQEASRLRIYPKGTLLVAMYGEGKTRGQVSELGLPATINQACAAIYGAKEQYIMPFVKIALKANYLAMRALAEGGNQPNLNLSKIKQFRIGLPTREEVFEICDRVEALFSLADQLEAKLNAARLVVERLTPALLAKAFRGELVSQDPSDEPASVLLERIRAARQAEAAAGKPSRRGRKQAAANPAPGVCDAAPVPPDLLVGLLRECGALSEQALLAASDLAPERFQRQLAKEMDAGRIREDLEDGERVLVLVG